MRSRRRTGLACSGAGNVRLAELERSQESAPIRDLRPPDELALQARATAGRNPNDLANRELERGRDRLRRPPAARLRCRPPCPATTSELMTVRARGEGYVSIRQKHTGSWFMSGVALPLFRTGDRLYPAWPSPTSRLKNWEATVAIDELDRGHLAPGQKVDIRVVALPFRAFHGSFKAFRGTFESWGEHRFECVMSVDDPAPELRPGMTAEVVVTTDILRTPCGFRLRRFSRATAARSCMCLGLGLRAAGRETGAPERNPGRRHRTGRQPGRALASPSSRPGRPPATPVRWRHSPDESLAPLLDLAGAAQSLREQKIRTLLTGLEWSSEWAP